jgi:hypothetical protein
MKMRCECGKVMSNTTAPCPTEGWLSGDQDRDATLDELCRDIAAYFRASREGRRDEWLNSFFLPLYPHDVPDESVVCDILLRNQGRIEHSVWECDECGRLWVQRKPGLNEYRSYRPDVPGYGAVLLKQA